MACATTLASAQTPGTLVPWFHSADGEPVWKRHQYWEDTSSTVYSLAWEFVQVPDQPVPVADVLLFNGPLFDPPEGVSAAPGTRRLVNSSVEHRALQLHVNYGGVRISPSGSTTYPQATFFIALDPPHVNVQTEPPVIQAGLSSAVIAATRGALGNVGAQLARGTRAPLWHEPGASLFPMNALYVTAGVPFPLSDFTPASQPYVSNACKDRLFIRQANQTWVDRSDLVPPGVLAGNSSGACFADFNGDGYLDLLVGKPGEAYTGAQSRLLIYSPATPTTPEGFRDATSALLPALLTATVDVAAADLDLDADQDIVLGNRVRLNPGSTAEMNESVDYVLINDGTGHFTPNVLAHGRLTDTRSVAIGDLDSVAGPEVVLANAGADGFSNDLVVPSADDHPLQIFRNVQPYPQLGLLDVVDEFITPGTEAEVSRPFAWQAVIVDLFAPLGPVRADELAPDGHADLVIVNHRDILLDATPTNGIRPAASNLRFLVNPASSSTRTLIDKGRMNVRWATTAAFADFSRNNDPNYGVCSVRTLDLFVGTGNRFSGCDSAYFENRGPAAGIWPPWNNSGPLINHLAYEALPGNERGYGFDFADYDGHGSGLLDALQTSRGYNFSVTNLGAFVQHGDNAHWNLTRSSSPVTLSNKRGQLLPIGAEDGVFADFDLDGKLEVLLATQRHSGGTHPAIPHPQTGDSILLTNGLASGFLHSTTTVAASFPPATPDPDLVNITTDAYIDIQRRDAYDRPSTADRALAVDLDNDGDEDGFVHLFPIFHPQLGGGGTPAIPQLGTAGLTAPVARYSAGWRLLENASAGPGAAPPWLRDVAATQLVDGGVGGGFSVNWNRALGVDIAGDFDNNGACDVFTAVGAPQVVGVDVTDVRQGHDLLFMNGVQGAPVGTLVERSVAMALPQRVVTSGGVTSTAGCAGLASGDVDNDGDTDLFVACGGRAFFSQLLMNKLSTSGRFSDEFAARIPTAAGSVSTAVHSQRFLLDTSRVHDDIGAPILVDLDADGDLDLVYAVAANVPRIYLNSGQDTNLDGWIDALDNLPPGNFFDATTSLLTQIRPIVDSVDAQAVDIDRDGDLDLAFDAFDDEVVLWRNELAQLGEQPAVSEAWPRIACVRGRRVVLEGRHLTSARGLQLRSRATGVTTVVPSTAITNETNGRISFVMPSSAPLGLVQIRVRRASAPTPADEWSRQYFGYCVLGP